VHLHQDAAQGPHVDGQVVGHSQQHLGGAVEPALDVLVDLKGDEKLSFYLSYVSVGSNPVTCRHRTLSEVLGAAQPQAASCHSAHTHTHTHPLHTGDVTHRCFI